ncbi:MAG: hypothetical protein ABIC04_03770 [Nanoarchaeota archaeon]
MPKKCIICDKEATLCIKDTSDYYCVECAQDQFADISYLQKMEEEAQKLKRILAEKLEQDSRSS